MMILGCPIVGMSQIIFDNNDDSERTVTDEDTLLIVEKLEGVGSPVQRRELEAAEIFLGELNSILYSRHYSMEFDCLFDLHSYPFDSQVRKLTDPCNDELVSRLTDDILWLIVSRSWSDIWELCRSVLWCCGCPSTTPTWSSWRPGQFTITAPPSSHSSPSSGSCSTTSLTGSSSPCSSEESSPTRNPVYKSLASYLS